MARFIYVSIWIYVGSLIVWYLARLVTGDKSIPVLFMNFMGVWLFFPLIILGIWALILEQKQGIYLLMIPLVLFLVFYGQFLIPHRATAIHSGGLVKVLTFNLRHTNKDCEALKEVLKSSHADVLALQEVTKTHDTILKDALSEDYTYHAYHEPAGLAIYSKYPIGEYKILSPANWPVQSAVIHTHQKPFHLINAHLARAGVLQFLMTWDSRQIRELADLRSHQIDLINQIISEADLQAIVACDCNMTNLNTGYSKLTSNLRDAFKEHGWGLGHTFLVPRGLEINSKINLPFQRIDYLFYSPEIRVRQVNLITCECGSDHIPLWAQFDLAP